MSNEKSKLSIFVILIGIVLLFLFFKPSFKSFNLGAIINLNPNLQFAGYSWDVTADGTLVGAGDQSHPSTIGTSSGNYQITKEGFLVLTSASSSGEYKGSGASFTDVYTCITTVEDISDIDEFLIIWDGFSSASCSNNGNGANGGIFINLYDKSTNTRRAVKGLGCGASNTGRGQCTFDLKPELVKFMNNFDGTYATYMTIGVGDIYIKDLTINVNDFKSRHLQICSQSSAKNMASGTSSVKIYNIVTKRLESPICKAGQVPLSNGTCKNLDSILLAHESAIYESLEEKINRIEERLQARELGLQQRIADFQELMTIAKKEDKLIWIDNKLIELQQKKINAEIEHNNLILELEASIQSMNNELDASQDSNRILFLENSISASEKELGYLKSIDQSKEIQDQIDFYNSQKTLLSTVGSEGRIDYLENELKLTQQILSSIQNNELNPPADVDIEEVISKVLGKINTEWQTSGQQLTSEEINSLINEEVSNQFRNRFPSGLNNATETSNFNWKYIAIGIGIILFLLLIFNRKK